jgi:hypothetical protein
VVQGGNAHLLNPNEYIRTAGLRGFQKNEVEVLVRNPQGQERQVLFGELLTIRRDRRHHKRSDYVTVFSLSREPRSDITYNLATGVFSITFHQGRMHRYIAFKEGKEEALTALLYLFLHRSKRHILQKIGASYKDLPILSKYYVQTFRTKIRMAQRRRFQSARRRRSKRP